MTTRFRPTLAQYRSMEEAYKEQVRVNKELKERIHANTSKRLAAEEAFIRENAERRRLEEQLQAEIDFGAERIKERDTARDNVEGLAILIVVLLAALLVALALAVFV